MAKRLVLVGVVGVLLASCGKSGNSLVGNGGSHQYSDPVFTGKEYESCAAYVSELKSAEKEVQTQNENVVLEAKSDSAPSSSTASNVQTNTQVGGVDEADGFKSSEHHIFVTNRDGSIEVLKRSTLTKIGRLNGSPNQSSKIYVSGDKLILVAGEYKSYNDAQTHVVVYKLEADKMPTEISKRSVDGYSSETRLKDNQLMIVANIYLMEQGKINSKYFADGKSIAGVPCQNISEVEFPKQQQNSAAPIAKKSMQSADLSVSYMPMISLTRVTLFDINDTAAAPLHHGIPGNYGSNKIYMSKNAIYLVNNRLEETSILKLKVDANGFSTAVGTVPGYIKDRWAMHELDDGEHFAIASTTSAWQLGQVSKNHLFILGESDGILKTVGSVTDFGLTETIKSVRYLNKMAYVVTFRTTDPLFAIDISKPREPKILGELKIPGFSSYMHPFGENRLVGIGLDAGAVQVSLFDITDPLQLGRLDVKLHSQSSGSSALLFNDDHAFFANAERKVFAFPVTEYGYKLSSYNWTNETSAVFYSIINDSLTKLISLDDSDLKNENKDTDCYSRYYGTQGISRIAEIDGRVITVSEFAIRAYDAESIYRGEKVAPATEYKRELISSPESVRWCHSYEK